MSSAQSQPLSDEPLGNSAGRPVFSAMIPWLLLCLALFAAAVFFYVGKQGEYRQKIALKDELEKTLEAQQAIETQLKELEVAKSSLETAVKFQEEKITSLNLQMEEKNERVNQAALDLSQHKAEIEQLKLILKNERDEKYALSAQFDKQSEELYNIKFQLQNILKTKAELEAKAKELAENGPVSLGAIVIKQS